MFRKSILAVVALAMASLGGVAPADATQLNCGFQCSSWVPEVQLTATSDATPLVGDFDGDDVDDVFWYGRGSAPDAVWFSHKLGLEESPAESFATVPKTVSGNYDPFVGDFNGDGNDDIFWYAPGAASDSVWYFNSNRTVVSVPQTVSGSYRPTVGNFDLADVSNDTEQDDIFWYGGSSSRSSLWSGNTNRTFSARTYVTSPPVGARVLTGEFVASEGDAPASPDLFFYVPGDGADARWVSDGEGGFVRTDRTVNGNYRPIVGDFDFQSGLTDILWFGPGDGRDWLYINNGDGFTATAITITGNAYPSVVRADPATGQDRILWNNPLGADSIWTPSSPAGTDFVRRTVTDMGGRHPVTGDFVRHENDKPTVEREVLWYAEGNAGGQNEVIWVNPGGPWGPLG